ncbi:MAG: hydroxymethylbilane synthase [Gemmatimonadaceae bacterium]
MRVRIGTRGSALALAQATDVAHRLEAYGHATELVVLSTAGDRMTDRAFADVGAFGIFVREIETALLEGRVDVAVHSYKDLPSTGPAGLVVAAVPERLDAADVLLMHPSAMTDATPIPLRDGARVGTSAARRTAQLRAAHPGLEIAPLRGNVPTRVRALVDGRYDAIVIAAAGLLRLERAAGAAAEPLVPPTLRRRRLDPAHFVPAPAQGAIAVQVRADDAGTRAAVAGIDDATSARALRAERAALALAEGGCTLPFGAWCRAAPAGALRLTVALGRSDGTIARAELEGDDPDALAASAWRAIASEALL